MALGNNERTIRILSTKKLLPKQKQFLLNAGFSIIEADFINIVHTDPEITNINENLVFTSSNAVKGILGKKEKLIDRPCFCVGQKTKMLLESNGFKVRISANNAESLASQIADFANEKFTFFTGNLKLDTLPEILKKAGVGFNEIEVYQTILAPKQIMAKSDAVLFFSPSGVESYLKENTISDEICFCIGSTTAKALDQTTKNIIIASQPSVENVIIKAINHYKKA